MESIEERMKKLKPLGAGDEQCAECLSYGVQDISVCRRCIADAPAFTEVVARFMEHARLEKRPEG